MNVALHFISMIAVVLPLQESGDEFVRLMNVGKAQLENRNSAQAIETFTAAVMLQPKSAPALRNLARAHFLARKFEAALEVLGPAAALEKESAGTSYLLGLANVKLSKFAEAIPHFEAAARRDPNTATVRFQLASAYQATENHDNAQEQLRETVRLDPLHASAHYKLASYARKAGDRAEFERRNVEFTRLRKLLGQPPSAEVLEMCVHTQPEPPPTPAATSQKAAPAIEVRFVDATKEAFGDRDTSAVAAAVVEMDAKGGYTLISVSPGGRVELLKMGRAGTFGRTQVSPPLSESKGPFCIIVGDYGNDVPTGAKYDPAIHARNDVFLINEQAAYLLRGMATAGFENVTAAAGLAGLTGKRACWADVEHDGDLDLVVAREGGLHVWQNNGNGTFTQVASDLGIPATGEVVDVAVADFDGNLAVDLLIARGESATLVFENQRAGKFAAMPEPPGPWPAARRVLADDLDNDGRPDAVLLGPSGVEVITTGAARRTKLQAHSGDQCLVLIDHDADGWLDILVFGSTPVKDIPSERGIGSILRNINGNFSDASTAPDRLPLLFRTGLVLDALAADLDSDGDSDLMLLAQDGGAAPRLHYLRNDGGHVNGQIKLRLSGTKTNASGIGTHVELRDGDFWVTRGVAGPVVEIGLGGRKRLDAVQTVWTNGVVDNQIGWTATPAPLSIVEKNVATGSCPFLYVWDGRRFRFVTDLLGNSPVGLPLSRGKLLPADPDEYAWMGDSRSVQPRSGAYALEVTSEFREVLYLDEARLVAVDHREEVEVHPSDKLMPAPFPPSELWALENARAARVAVGDDGVDRASALKDIDGRYSEPGPALPPPLRGMCRPLTITLDFGPIPSEKQLALALTGWLQYGDASANIAMSQDASLTIIPPKLEAEDGLGKWQPVDAVVGMPAGKTKTILCDLAGKLPAEVKKLRLTTTFEIRWDRIALCERHIGPQFKMHEVRPTGAELRWRGFSDLRARATGHPTTPDYASVRDRPAWRTSLEGWCTRYGDVRELVAARDGELVVVNGGDALSLRFDAAQLPSVPGGMTRSFFFYSVGWDKDADHNVVDGDTVEPMPGEAVSGQRSAVSPEKADEMKEPPPLEESDWRVRYNTRWTPRERFNE